MTTHTPTTGHRPERRAPWHTWAFSGLLASLYLIGVYDFVMLLEPNEAYVRSQGWGAAGIAYFTGYPLALRLIWAIHLACGIAAPVLLVIRVRAAAAAALAAMVAQAILMVATFALLGRLGALGPVTALFDSSILVLTALFWWYSRKQVSACG